jgi:heptosyltransferase-1
MAMASVAGAPSSILVVKPSSLGDVVHTLPAVARLKATWPEAGISWLINPEWAPLLDGNRDVDEAIVFPRNAFRGIGSVPRILRWAMEMRRRQFDLVLDFQGLLRSAIIARLVRSRRVVGLGDAREGARFFYDGIADVNTGLHAVERYLRLAELAGAVSKGDVRFTIPEGLRPEGFPSLERFVLLHPFSRGTGKSLSSDDVERFAAAMAPEAVVLAGRTNERAPEGVNVVDFLNRTSIAELIWLIRRAAFVVSVDSGPMHIAAAVTDRLVSIHTWSDPALVGPFHRDAWIFQSGKLRKAGDGMEAARPCPDMPALADFVRERIGEGDAGVRD